MAQPRSRSRHLPAQSPTAHNGGDTAKDDFTGKFIVLFQDDGVKEGLQALKDAAGLTDVCNAADYADAGVEMAEAEAAEVFVLDKLKVAVVKADPNQLSGLQAAAAEEKSILAVEPERIMYALPLLERPSPAQFPFEYLRGYKDAVNNLYATLSGVPVELREEAVPVGEFMDNAFFTWGLQATRVSQSTFSGKGIRVAVLDTGFDLDHPDFNGRHVVSKSFIRGEAVNDLNGHGTHCIGTALGPSHPAGGVRRYGCAYRADIYVGKVLSNQGSGADSGILAGINWAIANNCRVISMSLGAKVQPGETFSPIYERIASRILRANPGTLIVAAAGNDSRRPGEVWPVSRPANCPSILAVAALDSSMGMGFFSNGGINPNGGGVDIAGPGVEIFSSVPEPFPASVQPGGPGRPWPARYHTISGTSMATPHVAGIAAMWLEARGAGTTAQALWQLLTGNALRLSLSSKDVGAGLIQAPVSA